MSERSKQKPPSTIRNRLPSLSLESVASGLLVQCLDRTGIAAEIESLKGGIPSICYMKMVNDTTSTLASQKNGDGGAAREDAEHESIISEPESTSRHDEDDDEDLKNPEIQQQLEKNAEETKSASKNVKKTNGAVAAAAAAAVSPVILGGTIEKAAFCLLQGFMEDSSGDTNSKSSPNSSSSSSSNARQKQPILVPITRLPALLGRTHQTTDINFFGLGKNIKAVSRVQFCIDYRIPTGTIGQVYNAADGTSKFTYQPSGVEPEKNNSNEKEKKDGQEPGQGQGVVTILNPTNAIQDEAGFYAITCKGKNPIRVNGLKVDQDQTCLLTHGSDIKISAFSLYFLLPSQPSTKTMQVTVNVQQRQNNKGNDDENSSGEKNGTTAPPAAKKRKAPPQIISSTLPTADAATTPPNSAKRRRFPNQSLQDDLDQMTTDELLHEINTTVENGTWDRRCGFMGSTILYRAVREAAKARKIQESVQTTDGVSKAAITAWIHASPKFAYCLQLMQTKLEKKSYQCSIARAMQRAGYTRCSDKSFGRHVRWKLPSTAANGADHQHQQQHGLHRSPGPCETDGQEEEEEEDGEDEAASDDDDDDDDDNSSQDDASQEDKVTDGNEIDSDDDDDDDGIDNDDDDEGVEGSEDGATGGAWKTIKAEIDASSTDMLLAEFNQAIVHNRWDRRCQFVAATIANRAVIEAARAADFRQAAEPDGVSRAQVVDWITKSARYRKWAEYMSEKLKPRSYQANIVKSMQLAGFHRSNVKTFGCNIRWHLPDVSALDENIDVDDGDDDSADDNDGGGSGTGSDAQSQGTRSAADLKQADSSDNDSGSDAEDSDNDEIDDDTQ
jgi:hypothetical protein